ncbi:MAG: hypothetical protein CMJ18_14035 [Phycisphaeraceae bacterium]|nr:hypothetical protein [Phycisphaeraceae bacterium]
MTVLLVSMLAMAARAEGDAAQGDALDRRLAGQLEALGSEKYEARTEATVRLLADTSISEDTIVQMYARATSVEQRERLLDIARHHLLRRLRIKLSPGSEDGSIGIYPAPMPRQALRKLRQPAIQVRRTLPGFPAYERLQAGDLILEIDGRRLGQKANGPDLSIQFVQMIKAKKAGRRIRLSILRYDQPKTVIVELAGRSALEAIYPEHRMIMRARGQPLPGLAAPAAVSWKRLHERLQAVAPPTRRLEFDVAAAAAGQ